MAQGGDYQNKDGTGGEAFAGGNLVDECFHMKHDGPYILSMANRGKNTAGSQFFITLGKASHLDAKHVAFGRVIDGKDVIRDIENVETDEKDKPVNMQTVKIIDCGIGDGSVESDSDGSLSKEERDRQRSKKGRKKSKKKSRKHDSDGDESSISTVEDSSGKKRSKKKHKKSKSKESSRRQRRRKYSSDSDDDSDDSHDSRRKKKRKHKRRKYDSDSDTDDSDDSEDYSREKKRRKKRKKSSSRKSSKSRRRTSSRRHSSDEESNASSDESSRSRRRSKKSKKRKKESKSKSDRTASEKKQVNVFGKFGIIKESDLRTSEKVKRNFEIWLEEVKGIPQGTNVPKWEMAESFKEYAEDFNTATLPHEKFYDYDKWEMEEYNKRKQESTSKKGAISDEFQFQEERKRLAEEKRKRELELVRVTMSKDKIAEMKRQARMKTEMVNAYRVGDEETRKRLQRRLEPDEK